MPLYEYQCKNCGNTSEVLQKVSDAPAINCPHCGTDGLQRKISATRFQLKGQGWYETDFKNKNKPVKKTEGEPESPKDTKTDQKSSTSGETKSSSTDDSK
ncbi:MAG: zinc ribbon domain-containing protein [Proteobacteria bacterium]|nr:zinc ribbon domain-containing protein [Pseudomonadota bacterium]